MDQIKNSCRTDFENDCINSINKYKSRCPTMIGQHQPQHQTELEGVGRERERQAGRRVSRRADGQQVVRLGWVGRDREVEGRDREIERH
jgi:hypothetical protein